MSEEEKMKAFINALLEEFYPECGDIDGGTFQDLAEKHGILVKEIRHEPCCEFCNCAQVVYDEEWQEGVECFRAANWLSAQQSVQADDGYCHCPITKTEAVLAGSLCSKCFRHLR